MIRFLTMLVILVVTVALSGMTFASTLDSVSGKSAIQGTQPKDSDDEKKGGDDQKGDKEDK